MSDWIYTGRDSYSGVIESVDLSLVLSQQVILIDLDSPQKKATWSKAGNVIQLLQIDAISAPVEISDSYSYLGFNPMLLKFQIASGNNYKIRFKPVPWLTQFTISIWQYYGI